MAEILVTKQLSYAKATKNGISNLSSHSLAIIQARVFFAKSYCLMKEFPN